MTASEVFLCTDPSDGRVLEVPVQSLPDVVLLNRKDSVPLEQVSAEEVL